MAPSSSKQVILSKSSDWRTWITLVRIRATNNDIWELVNPELETQPARQSKPKEPEIAYLEQPTGMRAQLALEAFKDENQVYKFKLAAYKREAKALADLSNFILETISAENVVYVEQADPHPWNILRTLKQRLAPTAEAESTRWNKLISSYARVRCPIRM